MIWSISWKNIWRNKYRSLTVIVAATLGIISGVLVVGIMQGWVEQRLHDAIFNEVSHLQIHNTEFLKNEEIHYTVNAVPELIPEIEKIQELKGWSARTKIAAMVTTPWASTGVYILGIDPEKEKQVTEIYKRIVVGGGQYLENKTHGNILISDKIAELLKLKQYVITEDVISKLKKEKASEEVLASLNKLLNTRFRSPKDFRESLKSQLSKRNLDKYGLDIMNLSLDYRIRNKIQITIADVGGNPVQGTFRVCGIFKTTNGGFDQGTVFVNADDLAELSGGKSVLPHEIAILLNTDANTAAAKEKLIGISDRNTVSTWKELAPDAAMMNDFMIMYYLLFIGIVMLALAFGIINTMMMAILERTKELGMLMAIGMNRRKVFSMIMLETIFLTMVGAVAGMISGWLLITVLGKTGIHFSAWGEGFEAIGFAAKVYPVVTPAFFIIITVMVIFTAVISSVWPARKALKLVPVEAIRTD